MIRTHSRRIGAGIVVAIALAACGGGGSDATAEPETTPSTDTTSTDSPAATDTTATSEAVEAAELAEWQQIELTDADGETFTFADFVGQPVFVESFATWCGNCRRQLGDTDAAAEAAGDAAVFVALSVETELDRDDMAGYADDQGFDHIRFAVMSPEMLAAFSDAFGTSALNPPSTPHATVTADGRVGDLVTGYESPEEILASLGLG